MKKLFFLSFFLPVFATAQNFYFAGRLGISGYNGDLKKNANPFSQPKLMGSLGVHYDLTEHITARTYLTLGGLRADDRKGTDYMKLRNLNFRSKLFEWELSAQYNLFSLNDRWWTPYVYAGVALYHFKPYTKDAAGEKVYLQPLATEGQPKPYKLTQFAIPFGFGASYSLNEDMRVGLELGYRKLFTDYLDDVSTVYADAATLSGAHGQQSVDLAWRTDEINGAPYPIAGTERGNPQYKDGYYYIGVTFIVRYWFDKYKQIAGIPGGGKEKKVGCPASRRLGY
jgi:hypothetical protein